MCGIVAELATGAPVARDRFERMVESLGARGPDGAGLRLLDGDRVALGHTRLAIIDLSEAGLQPLPNEDETAWLVFNGEIYNYRELRNELIGVGHRFRSQTDSEVVVHAYEEWGDDCVHRLRGMFAFAIWDSARRRLFAARDRLGVKPLYLWQHPGGLVIASQPRAILAHPAFRPEVDRAAFQNYLAYSYVPRDLSIYEGVSKVPAGHRVAVEGTSLRVDRYWEPHYRPEIRDPAEAAEMIRLKLAEAVETQLVSDVPIGFFLSGGIDSTSVAAIAASRCEEVPPSFTIGFDDAEGDERVHARLAAERLGCPAHERTLTVGDAFDLLPAYVRAYDEPFYDHSAIPSLAVSELARSHGVKVVLSGDGGDEVFGGYTWYDAFLDPPRVPAWRRLARRLRSRGEDPHAAYFRWMGFLNARAQTDLLPGAPDFDHLSLFRRFRDPDLPDITSLQLLDLHTFLVDDVLTKVDRASMACGVEVRVPLLDHELVEAAFSIDHRVLRAGGERKSLLKAAVRGWVPPELLTTRKKGFGMPLAAWMGRGLHECAERVLVGGSLVGRGLLDGDGLGRLLAERRARPTWLLLAAELWARHWLEGEEPASAALLARNAVS